MIKLIVYGVGKRGKDFIQYVQELCTDIGVVAVSDTYVREVELEIGMNVPFVKASEIPHYIFDYIVVTPRDYYEDIKMRLLDLGIAERKIKSIKDIYMEYGRFYCKQSDDAEYYCNICKNSVSAWRYIGNSYDIFKTKRIIGSSRRRGGCPICGSSDRERYIYSVLEKYTNLLDGSEHRVLHFAPEDGLAQILKKTCGTGYISADIVQGRADIVADITDIPFAADTFEYVICNHVMEHILKEQQAFDGIKNCLVQGGVLILTVPICWEQPTFEDTNINTKTERIKNYGQEDHVRLYGNDIVKRMERFGFHVTLLRCSEMADEKEIRRGGFIEEDTVLLLRK